MSMGTTNESKYPRKLGRYTLLSLLGEGGNSFVHKGVLNGPFGFSKEVAIKQMKPSVKTEAVSVQYFVKEARIGGLLRHPNLVEIYEIDESNGECFISMELVDGLSLGHILKKTRPFPPSIVLQVGIQICRALHSAHTLKTADRLTAVVHCDLKPSNILLDYFGTLKILDFGIAQWINAERVDVIQGTPAYMAPEQFLHKPLDGRTDLFSLAAILYELLLGSSLFYGSLRKMIRTRLNTDRVLAVPALWDGVEQRCPGLSVVLDRCLRRNPEERYASAQQLERALTKVKQGLSTEQELSTWITSQLNGWSGEDDEKSPDPDQTETVKINNDRVTEVLEGPPQLRKADSFFGRQEMVDKLLAQLDGPGLTSVVGFGGVGKTRLVIEALGHRKSHVGQPVVFCEFAEARTHNDVIAAISKPLGLVLSSETEAEQIRELATALSGQPSTLFVLDNVEQVQEWVTNLLIQGFHYEQKHTVLVTSRVAMNVEGESIVRLEGLSVQDGIRLFVDRSTRPISPDEPGLSELVQQLDGLPLALELAARRSNIYSPLALLKRLHERFSLITDDRMDANRHSALSVVLDSTWEALSNWECDALMQCSVFRGGFMIEDAEEVVDLSAYSEAPWVVDAIQSLVDKCLIQVVSGSYGQRLSLLVSVAAYASDRLKQGGARAIQAVYKRHAVHFSRFGKQAYFESMNTSRAPKHQVHLNEAVPNTLAATERSIEQGWGELALLSTRAMLNALSGVGGYPEETVYSIVRRLETMDIEPASLLYIQHHESWFRYTKGDLPGASKICEDVISGAEQYGLYFLRDEALNVMGIYAKRMGKYSEALSFYHRALTGFRAHERSGEIGVTVGNIGVLYKEFGQFEKASDYLEESLAIHRDLGNYGQEGIVLGTLGTIYTELNRFSEAQAALEKSLLILREVQNSRFESISLASLGYLASRRGLGYEVAIEWYHKGLSIAKSVGDKLVMGQISTDLGRLHMKEQKWVAALEAFSSGAIAFESANALPQLTLVLCWRGQTEVHQGRLLAARKTLEAVEQHVAEMRPTSQQVQVELKAFRTVLTQSINR